MKSSHSIAAIGVLGGLALGGQALASRQPIRPAASTAAAYPIHAVPITAVHLTDDFWRPRLETNRTVTIPHIMRENELTGRVANFLKAAHLESGAYQGQRYNDTDVYKVIEAASYALAQKPGAALDKQVDDLIAIIAKAQEADGYLYTPRTVDPKNPAPGAGPERWSWLATSHELYDQGHMIEAAVAHFRATGKRTFLDVAIKSADLICRAFGTSTRHDAPGHEEIELALVKLAEATGDRKYVDEAAFFLDQRGRPHTSPPPVFAPGTRFAMYNDLAYRQDQAPAADQTRAVGHAVRAMYLYAGMTDIATLLDRAPFASAIDALWQDVTRKQMYITGGLGADGRTEAFGGDYVLPNHAYAETCASVGGILWYHRMFLREGDAKYYDTLERTLYNGYLSGVSLGGDAFFYQNPLVSDGSVARSAYFDVACCPANLARLMEQIPGLIYALHGSDVFVNLFVGSTATIDTGAARLVLAQRTKYPWDGAVRLRLDPDRDAELTLALRIPGWARPSSEPDALYRFADSNMPAVTLQVNGRQVPLALDKGYARIHRVWKRGDTVQLTVPMPIHRVLANAAVAEDRDAAAIQRGPMVYSVEGADNGPSLAGLRLPLQAALQHHFEPALLHGVEVVTGTARRLDESGAARDIPLQAIPYYAWANRGKGEMAVWIPTSR